TDSAMRRLALACTLIALVTAACSSETDQTTAPAATRTAGLLSSVSCSADLAGIQTLINQLFPGGNQNAVSVRWGHNGDNISNGTAVDSVTFNLVDYVLKKYQSGQTIGGQSDANAANVTSLVNQMFCYAGINAQIPGLGPDDGFALYGPASPATLVTTGNKQGGVSLPPGNGN